MLDPAQAPLVQPGSAAPAGPSAFQLTDAILNLWGAVSVQATYWHVYLAVVLAFLAFLVNNWSKPKHKVAVAGLAVGMIVFFAASCYEICLLQDRANHWRLAIHQYVGAHRDKVPPEFVAIYSAQPQVPPTWAVAALHLTADFGLLGLLAYNYRRVRVQPEVPAL